MKAMHCKIHRNNYTEYNDTSILVVRSLGTVSETNERKTAVQQYITLIYSLGILHLLLPSGTANKSLKISVERGRLQQSRSRKSHTE